MTDLNKIDRFKRSEDSTFININELYKHMIKLGRDKFVIELIEIKIVDDMHELTQLEQKHINNYNPEILLNMKRANINE